MIYFQVNCLSQNYIPVSYSAVAERAISLYVFAAGTTKSTFTAWCRMRYVLVGMCKFKGVLATSEVQDNVYTFHISLIFQLLIVVVVFALLLWSKVCV